MNTTQNMAQDPARNELLQLVDGLGRHTGTATKMQAHTEDLLHRAFSVLLVRHHEGQTHVLLAQRALHKYHSGGLWANSCCSHPRDGEELLAAAHRRVQEELGCSISDVREVAAFAYHAQFDDGISEHEYDHVLLARATSDIHPNPSEIMQTRWASVDEVAAQLADEPQLFSAWAPMVFSLALPYVEEF